MIGIGRPRLKQSKEVLIRLLGTNDLINNIGRLLQNRLKDQMHIYLRLKSNSMASLRSCLVSMLLEDSDLLLKSVVPFAK
jgi:hypothetical protein